MCVCANCIGDEELVFQELCHLVDMRRVLAAWQCSVSRQNTDSEFMKYGTLLFTLMSHFQNRLCKYEKSSIYMSR